MFKNLLEKYEFEELWNSTEKEWKERNKEKKEQLKSIYFSLKEKKPNKEAEEMTLIIKKRKVLIENTKEEKLEVKAERKSDLNTYSINMEKWEDVLAFDYEINGITEQKFILEVLRAISYYGAEKQVEQKRREVEEAILRIENKKECNELEKMINEVLEEIEGRKKEEKITAMEIDILNIESEENYQRVVGLIAIPDTLYDIMEKMINFTYHLKANRAIRTDEVIVMVYEYIRLFGMKGEVDEDEIEEAFMFENEDSDEFFQHLIVEGIKKITCSVINERVMEELYERKEGYQWNTKLKIFDYRKKEIDKVEQTMKNYLIRFKKVNAKNKNLNQINMYEK